MLLICNIKKNKPMETIYLVIVFLVTLVAIVTAVHHYAKNDRLTTDLEIINSSLKSANKLLLDKKEELFRVNAKLAAGLEVGRTLRKERDILIVELESANAKLEALVALNKAVEAKETVVEVVVEETKEEVEVAPVMEPVTPVTPITPTIPTPLSTSKKSNRRKR
jgi:hypothetical protein